MVRWQVVLAGACIAAGGAVHAQGVVEKPAPSRFYGTARPPVAAPAARPAPLPPAAGGHAYRPAPHHPRPPAVVYVPPPRPVHVHRPRVGVDVVIGAPWPRPYWGPRYVYPPVWGWPSYPPAVVVPPPVVVSPPPPPVYVERPAEPAAPVAGYWYWCTDPQGWHPDVGECPAGWQAVPPRAAQ